MGGIRGPFNPGPSSKRLSILTYLRGKICVKEQNEVSSKIQDLLKLSVGGLIPGLYLETALPVGVSEALNDMHSVPPSV